MKTLEPSSREELAWAAGFYDGEGSTSYGTHKGGSRPYIIPSASVSQKNATTLERFQRAVGGRGRIYERRNRPGMFQWETSRWVEARDVVNLLWPWLCEPKRQQAAAVFAVYDEQRATRPPRAKAVSCKRGHSLADAWVHGKVKPQRVCKTCRRDSWARQKAVRSSQVSQDRLAGVA